VARIVLECLTCHHRGIMADRDMEDRGLQPATSLVTLTKRLVCRRCGSRAVKAYREPEDEPGPPLVPQG
jgi:hypothetical protein